MPASRGELADVEVQDEEGVTPLMAAAAAGQLKALQRLLELRPQLRLNGTDGQGRTALDHAVERGRQAPGLFRCWS